MNAGKWLLPLLALAAVACGDESKGAAAPTTLPARIPGIEQNLPALSGPSLSKRPTQPTASLQVGGEDSPQEILGTPGTSRTPRSVDDDLLSMPSAHR